MAVVLSGDIEPLQHAEAEDGDYKLSHHHSRDVYYNITEECYLAHGSAVPMRAVTGFWQHPHLQVVLDQYRESEIVQAVARARPLTNPCDVYIFTSVATPLSMDGVYQDPGELLNAPPGIQWRYWAHLIAWLNERRDNGEVFGYDEIAEYLVPKRADVDARYELMRKLRRNAMNQKWLDSIYERFGGEIVQMRLPEDTGRGRPPTRLRLT
jgi:hypothetical protein